MRAKALVSVLVIALAVCSGFARKLAFGRSARERVLYSFQGGRDGADPVGGLVFDATGKLYGTTFRGGTGCGSDGCGTVYVLTPADGTWKESVLHRFTGPGILPTAGLIIAGSSNLYGTTSSAYSGDSTAFSLTRGSDGRWTESTLHEFKGGNDGAYTLGGLISDASGNLYGTTSAGGGRGSCQDYFYSYCGTVFELSPPRRKGGKWTENVLYRFKGGHDGANPSASLIFDNAGHLYGTTAVGGATGRSCSTFGCGTVFELVPSGNGKWTEKVLHRFDERTDGAEPFSTLVLGKDGSLYGTTYSGGYAGFGTVFKLAPTADGWKSSVLHAFQGGHDGGNSYSGLTLDSEGRLYGTTSGALTKGGGTVFKLTPLGGDRWMETVLYGFPINSGSEAPVIFDSSGDLYGTGGSGDYGWGAVFEVQP